MKRLATIILPALIAACGPVEAPVCPEVRVTCPVVLDEVWLWRTIPPDLGPGEIVVEETLDGMTPGVVSSPSTGWRNGLFGEEAFACIEKTPVSLNRYRVDRLAAGAFTPTHFTVVMYPPGCSRTASPAFDPTALERDHARRIGDERPLYMIMRPAPVPEGLDAAARKSIRESAPVMEHR